MLEVIRVCPDVDAPVVNLPEYVVQAAAAAGYPKIRMSGVFVPREKYLAYAGEQLARIVEKDSDVWLVFVLVQQAEAAAFEQQLVDMIKDTYDEQTLDMVDGDQAIWINTKCLRLTGI